ncbi:MAG: hypothetical protein MJZ13_10385 [Bacteroidales bacterium]|nr:hypothetical protein [Bacteroidales bacterium]
MSGIVNLAEHLQKLPAGFSVRDFLLDLQNYYLEAINNGIYMMPSSDSISDIEEIVINLDGQFGDFSKKVKSLLILPDEDIEFDEILPDPEQLPCMKNAKIIRDADGVERLFLEVKEA